MNEILQLINDMSPYLLLGFLVAGLLHAFVPGRLYSKYLSRADWRSVLLAALFGIPLPLCSCGVIPTAMSLRREGASRGATTSFLIATPQTGVDSILATYSILGLPFAILRPIAALVTSLFGGGLVNALVPESDARTAHGVIAPDGGFTQASAKTEACDEEEIPADLGFFARLKLAFRYGFIDMVQDIGKWLVIGLIIAGLIALFVPDDFFTRFADNPLLTYGIVLLIAIPMYVCATGSIPVAAVLMLKGLSPGAALVFLMAGPASNMASILVIGRVLGRRTQLIYLAALVIGAFVFGVGIDYLLPRELFASVTAPEMMCHMHTPWWKWTSSLILALLLFYVFAVRRFVHRPSALSVTDASPDATVARRYTVEGMTCNHCRTHVEKALREVPGVTKAEVDLDRAEAVVEGEASDAALVAAVSAIGYTLKPRKNSES